LNWTQPTNRLNHWLDWALVRSRLGYRNSIATVCAAADDPSAPPERHLHGLVRATLFAYRDVDSLHKVQLNELGKLDAL
jgi:hypothetical protein